MRCRKVNTQTVNSAGLDFGCILRAGSRSPAPHRKKRVCPHPRSRSRPASRPGPNRNYRIRNAAKSGQQTVLIFRAALRWPKEKGAFDVRPTVYPAKHGDGGWEWPDTRAMRHVRSSSLRCAGRLWAKAGRSGMLSGNDGRPTLIAASRRRDFSVISHPPPVFSNEHSWPNASTNPARQWTSPTCASRACGASLRIASTTPAGTERQLKSGATLPTPTGWGKLMSKWRVENSVYSNPDSRCAED